MVENMEESDDERTVSEVFGGVDGTDEILAAIIGARENGMSVHEAFEDAWAERAERRLAALIALVNARLRQLRK